MATRVSFRPIRPSDLDAVHRLVRRAEAHDLIPIATPREEIAQWLDEPHFDLEQDSRLATVGGDAVAWSRIWHQPSGEREARAYLFGAVDPDHRGVGIGSAIFAWQLERASERLGTTRAGLPRFIRAEVYDFQQDAARLYRRHGLAPVRYHDQLVRDLTSLPEAPPVEGVAIAPWNAASSEAVRMAMNESFLDHWGSAPRDAAAWNHLMASPGTRIDLSFVALAGDAVAGVCRNGHFPDDEAVTGRRDGWIMQVGVVRPHRRRGIATALIVASLAAFREADFTHAALGVDSENPSGAHHLYERLGYRPAHRMVVYQRALE